MSSCAIWTAGRPAFHVLRRWLGWAPMQMIVRLAPAAAPAQATRPLPPFNVNIAQSSVSGLSSPTRSSIIAITMRPARSSNGFTARCGGARRDGSRDRLSSSTKTSSCQMRRVTV